MRGLPGIVVGLISAVCSYGQAYQPKAAIASGSVALTSTSTTTIVSESVAGRLISAGCHSLTTLGGTPDVNLLITIDGGTARSHTVHGNSDLYAQTARATSISILGDGDVATHKISWQFNVRYLTSLEVSVQVAATGTGSINCSVFRSHEI